MDCEKFRKLVRDDLEGKLRWPRGRGYKEHRESCQECNRYFVREEVLHESRSVGGKPEAERTPIVRIAYTIIQQALVDGAHSILLCPSPEGIRIDFRTNGEWKDMMPLPAYIEIPLIARLKLMADLDVHEDRAPQEGVVRICHEGTNYVLDLRTSRADSGEQVEMKIRTTDDWDPKT